MAGEIAELLRASVPRQIELRLELGAGLPPVEGDPAQLRQVVLNLVTNAADSIGPLPGSITLRTRRRTVAAGERVECVLGATAGPGEYVELSVADTGCGMDAETRSHIFDPFFTTKAAGRGLGLAATAGIVRAHGGALELHSAPGAGSSFVMLLPAAGFTDEPPLPAEPPLGAGGGVVLVVDDQPSVRQVVALMLEWHGYTALSAAGGLEALEVIASHPEIGLVALDMTMPGIRGSVLLDELRRARPGLPVLLMSGYAEQAAPVGEGVSFIQKPFGGDEFVRRIQEMLTRA
jgi:CheY-like chemotaxis protein